MYVVVCGCVWLFVLVWVRGFVCRCVMLSVCVCGCVCVWLVLFVWVRGFVCVCVCVCVDVYSKV